MEDKPEFEKDTRLRATYASGLIAISIVILQAFISIGKLDILTTAAAAALALALPMLSGCAIVFTFSEKKSVIESGRLSFTFFTGAFCVGIGVALALFHVSEIAFLAFVIGVIFTFIITPGPYHK